MFSRFLFSSLLLSLPLFSEDPKEVAQGDVQYNEKQNRDDMDALRRWIRDKRLVTVKEIGGDLSLSGEVRSEFQAYSETRNGVRQRGENSATDKPQYPWDVEVNLMIDYRTDRTWTAIKLEFDNDMGIRSGTTNKVKLEKAYLGGRVIPGDTFTMDAEIGRRYLSNVFDSKVEFGSLFDGGLLRFNKAFPSLGDYYVNAGAFLVDDATNHYGYVAEMGALHIGNVGLNLKYSIIDWYKPYANQFNDLRFKYLVSQFLASYEFYPDWIGKRLIKFYGAGLFNALAGGLPVTNGEKQNLAGYVGVAIGLVKKKYDWAIDVNYQWVQAQAIPEFDNSGIGRGNTAGVGLYTLNVDGNPSSGSTTRETAVGNGNFQGFQIDALYAFTDNLSVQQIFKWSNTLNKNIGPDLKFRMFEIEFIYAF